MKILKFGGTSVANAQNIQKVKHIVSQIDSELAIIVVSALGGVTDLLLTAQNQAAEQDDSYKSTLAEIENRHIQTIKELLPIERQSGVLSAVKSNHNTSEALLEGAVLIGESTPQLSDKIVSYGELLSSYIISEYFVSAGLDAGFKDSRELIQTDETYGKAVVNFKKTDAQCQAYFDGNTKKYTVAPGFVASSGSGNTTTLGRGGSDYTAAVLAAALNAEELQIWTDVSGMYTANPKLVKQSRAITRISYEEAMELSHFGAKVLYPPTIQPVLAKAIPIRIKNTFDPDAEGTLITSMPNGGDKTVRGISYIEQIALLSLEGPGMIGIPGVSKRFFEVLSQAGISIVLITQASSEHSICIGISEAEAKAARELVNNEFDHEISRGKLQPVVVEKDLAIIALVGDNMKSHQGLSGKMFSALGRNNVNIRAIAQGASERNISAVINAADAKKALNTLHEEFFETRVKQLNLFVMGVGNVGSRLLKQLHQQQAFLKENLKLNIRVIGISNSRKMCFNPEGIALADWNETLSKGEDADKELFFDRVRQLNYRNSIFVDNTASEEVSDSYATYLKESIAVVTCNKIACSSEYSNYRDLK
ncbi:MAG: aspartate kinase, partial [Bacteroidota bacterium]